MLIHFAHYDAARETWCAAYRRPSTGEIIAAVAGCGSEQRAELEAERLNAEQRARQTAPTPTGDRAWRAPRGLYDDRDGLGE